MQQPWGENPCGFALMDLLLKYALSHCSTKHRLSFRPLVLLGHRRIPAISALPAPCHFNHSYTSDKILECDCSFCPLYHTLPGSWCTSTIYFRKTVFPCMHSLSCFLHLIPLLCLWQIDIIQEELTLCIIAILTQNMLLSYLFTLFIHKRKKQDLLVH